MPEYTERKPWSVCVCSWNVAGKKPPAELGDAQAMISKEESRTRRRSTPQVSSTPKFKGPPCALLSTHEERCSRTRTGRQRRSPPPALLPQPSLSGTSHCMRLMPSSPPAASLSLLVGDDDQHLVTSSPESRRPVAARPPARITIRVLRCMCVKTGYLDRLLKRFVSSKY